MVIGMAFDWQISLFVILLGLCGALLLAVQLGYSPKPFAEPSCWASAEPFCWACEGPIAYQ